MNLGVAIDLEKKDGSRTLLVPNIKNADALDFAQFLAAYDDVVKRARTGKLGIARLSGHDHLAHQSRHDRHCRFERRD